MTRGRAPAHSSVHPTGELHRCAAKVNRDGRVRVRIEGLVFAERPDVGENTVPQVAATVSCGGTAVGTTKAVPFSPRGRRLD